MVVSLTIIFLIIFLCVCEFGKVDSLGIVSHWQDQPKPVGRSVHRLPSSNRNRYANYPQIPHSWTYTDEENKKNGVKDILDGKRDMPRFERVGNIWLGKDDLEFVRPHSKNTLSAQVAKDIHVGNENVLSGSRVQLSMLTEVNMDMLAMMYRMRADGTSDYFPLISGVFSSINENVKTIVQREAVEKTFKQLHYSAYTCTYSHRTNYLSENLFVTAVPDTVAIEVIIGQISSGIYGIPSTYPQLGVVTVDYWRRYIVSNAAGESIHISFPPGPTARRIDIPYFDGAESDSLEYLQYRFREKYRVSMNVLKVIAELNAADDLVAALSRASEWIVVKDWMPMEGESQKTFHVSTTAKA